MGGTLGPGDFELENLHLHQNGVENRKFALSFTLMDFFKLSFQFLLNSTVYELEILYTKMGYSFIRKPIKFISELKLRQN